MENAGFSDRLMRTVGGMAGMVAIASGIVGLPAPFILVPAFVMYTGVVGWCPAYQAFGWDTRPVAA
jgi:hypothetical protein